MKTIHFSSGITLLSLCVIEHNLNGMRATRFVPSQIFSTSNPSVKIRNYGVFKNPNRFNTISSPFTKTTWKSHTPLLTKSFATQQAPAWGKRFGRGVYKTAKTGFKLGTATAVLGTAYLGIEYIKPVYDVAIKFENELSDLDKKIASIKKIQKLSFQEYMNPYSSTNIELSKLKEHRSMITARQEQQLHQIAEKIAQKIVYLDLDINSEEESYIARLPKKEQEEIYYERIFKEKKRIIELTRKALAQEKQKNF